MRSSQQRLLLALQQYHRQIRPLEASMMFPTAQHSTKASSNRLFGSAAVSSSRSGRMHKHKKSQRPAVWEKSSKRSATHPKRSNQLNRKKKSQEYNVRVASSSRGKSNQKKKDLDAKTSGNHSVAASIMDRWEDDYRSRRNNDDDSEDDEDDDTDRFRGRRRSIHFERFRNRQQEYCQAMEDYRRFWYPGTTANTISNENSTNNWKHAMSFQHPDPNEDLPWMDLSYEKLLESEKLFRGVCASHHALFVACASYLAEQTESYKNYSKRHGSAENRHRRFTPSNRDDSFEYDSDGWDSDEDIVLNDCDQLLTKILPNWEELRRQRTALVHKYQPENVFSDKSVGSQEQQVSPWVTSNDLTKSQSDTNPKPPSVVHDQDGDSNDNNRWVGWLKKIISGGETPPDKNGAVIRAATAHVDPEFAPNHYHYTKLIGHLYYHYLPNERHVRNNPFHMYSKSEREEGVVDRQNLYGNDYDESLDALANVPYKSDSTLNSNGERSLEEPHKIPYQAALAAYERKRLEILRERARTIQYVVDQSLLPSAPIVEISSHAANVDTQSSAGTTTQLQEDDSNRVLSDKIVRLLIRSYLDQETLEAAQQAERVYNRHPNHRKHLLWYVAMSYIKVIKSTLKKQRTNNGNQSKNIRKSSGSSKPGKAGDELAIAAKRIYELVSSKYAKETREFQHCSGIAFEGLAILPEHSRRELRGYYDRVHSLGILKFGPKVWESLIHGTGTGDGGSDNQQRQPESAQQSVDLSEALNSRDHKILHNLIQIYSNDEKHFPRALRILDVSLHLFPPYDLHESLTRSTFHKLLRKLSTQREKAWRKKRVSSTDVSTFRIVSNEDDTLTAELDTALRLLDKMVSHDSWFPNEESFRIAFEMASFSDNPAPGTEKVRAKLEMCRFLVDLSNPKKTQRDSIDSSGGVSNKQYPFNPIDASIHALDAWITTASYNNLSTPPNQPHPAERAWSILQASRMESWAQPLLFRGDDKQNVERTPGPTTAQCVTEQESHKQQTDHTVSNHPQKEILYTMALKVCSRIVDCPKSREVAMDIFEVAKTDEVLLKGEVARVLLGVIMKFSNLESENIRRVQAAKKVYEGLRELDPDFHKTKPNILGFLRKQASYIRIRYPTLYEDHLAELELLEGESSIE